MRVVRVLIVAHLYQVASERGARRYGLALATTMATAAVRLAAGDDSGDDGGGGSGAAALLPGRAPPALALDKQRLQVAVCLAKRQDFTDLPAYAHATALVHEVDAAEERWLRGERTGLPAVQGVPMAAELSASSAACAQQAAARFSGKLRYVVGSGTRAAALTVPYINKDWHVRAAARAASGYQENARSMMSIISRMTCLSIDDGRGGSGGSAPVVSCTEDEISGLVASSTRDGDVMERRHEATVNGVTTAAVTSTQLTVAAVSTAERPPAVNGAAAHPPPQQSVQSQSQVAGYISITSDMMRAQDRARRETDARLLELREKHKQQWLAANEEAGQLLRQTTHFKMAEDLHREQQRFELLRAEEKRAHRDALEARQRQKEEREREEAALDAQLQRDLAALNRWGRAGPLLACAVAATALLTRGSVWSLVADALSRYFRQCDNPAPPASYSYAHYYPSFSPWDLLSWAVPASAARTYCQLSLALRAAAAAAPLALLQRALPALAGSAAMPLAAALCTSYAVTGRWLPVAVIARALWLPAPAAIAAAAAAAARRRRRQRRRGWGSACVRVGVPAAVVAAAAWCGLRVGCQRGGGSGECAARVLQALRQHASAVLARM
ncbi:hypothetical protein JKP88DRAFT_354284 [Tribonema minus]|uniref:Uncharacterized protein n=1 Tax=Tribonema minus TaxID=303371 RepID=A0A835Z0R7_9STRA|nr:hypothetical protein JKP88DRAFT_354284 [Tribonema minus]